MSSDSFANDDTNLPKSRIKYSPQMHNDEIQLDDYYRFCRQGCTASEEKFEMIAVMRLKAVNPPDIWLINEKKEIQHAQDGTTAAP